MNFKLEYIKIPLKLLSLTSLIWFSINAFAVITDLPSEVRSKEFSLSRKALALNGYDPVAYFLDGSTKGSPLITYEWKGVVYHFAAEANRAQFIQEPLEYEPQYGGWCAWAMADGGGRTVVYRAERVHDFAWCAAPAELMEVVETDFEPGRDVPMAWLERAQSLLGLSAAELELPPMRLTLIVPRSQRALAPRMVPLSCRLL